MKELLFSFLLLLSLAACNLDKSTQVDENQAKFTTSDASELFFKNVRQVRYDHQEIPESKLNIFRIDERSSAEDYPVLNLAIAVNWRYDEAYLLTEPNEYLQSLDTIQVHWQDSVGQQQGTYQWTGGNKEAHFKFASQIYRSIQQGHQLSITGPAGEEEAFLRKYDDREAFRKTVFDYYRLVDLL